MMMMQSSLLLRDLMLSGRPATSYDEALAFVVPYNTAAAAVCDLLPYIYILIDVVFFFKEKLLVQKIQKDSIIPYLTHGCYAPYFEVYV